MGPRWIVSGRTRARVIRIGLLLTVVAVLVGWAVAEVVAQPSVPSVVMAAILGAAGVAAVVLAGEAFGAGFVHVDSSGYRAPMATPRRWTDVLAVGTATVEGRTVPAVAVRSREGVGIEQDVFTGFADADAEALLTELRSRTPQATGDFSRVAVPATWWAVVDAEAERVRAGVAAASGHQATSARVELGYPGLATAVELDYGVNSAGERVTVVVHGRSDLALTVGGVRYLRQDRKKTPDPVDEVGLLFEPHATELSPASELGLAQAVVAVDGRRPLRFNAEEPDRF